MTPLNFDAQLSRAVETLGERLREDISRQLRQLADDLSEAARADREAAVAAAVPPAPEPPTPAAPPRDDRAATWLVEGVRAVDAARSLNDVLAALVHAAGQPGMRAGLFLVQASRVRAHQPPEFAASFAGLDIPVQNAGIVGDAVQRGRVESGTRAGGLPSFGAPDALEAVALPIQLDGKVVAVLYVERHDPDGTLDPPALEVLARHAARVLEAVTAFKTARALAPADTRSMNAVASPGSAADEEEAARRYARLVISEIKLYNEDAVAEGRRARDLATRLGGEIARARVLYEQRVPAHFRGAAEHFQAELVRTLAGGDATLFEKATVS